MSVFDDWQPHLCAVNTIGVADEWGAVPVTPHSSVPCLIEDETLLVRSPDGSEVVSASRVHVDLAVGAWFTPGSQVQVRGLWTTVIRSQTVDDDPDLAGVTVHLR